MRYPGEHDELVPRCNGRDQGRAAEVKDRAQHAAAEPMCPSRATYRPRCEVLGCSPIRVCAALQQAGADEPRRPGPFDCH